MKTIWKISRLAALALTFGINLSAAADNSGRFSGTVVDEHGKPVAGAAVDCYLYPMSAGQPEFTEKGHAVTDDRGAFEFKAAQGQGVVLVTKAGIPPTWIRYSAQSEAQKIVIAEPSHLAGVVVNNAGQPVADAEVWVATALSKNSDAFGESIMVYGNLTRKMFSARTSADGKFRIENFPANGQANLAVKKSGQAMVKSGKPLEYNQLPFKAGQEDITLTVEPAGTVNGKVVVRGSGEPLPSAMIQVIPTENQGFATVPDPVYSGANGTFQVTGLPAGDHSIVTTFTNQPIPEWVADRVPVKVVSGQAVSDLQVQAFKGGLLDVTVRRQKGHELLADTTVMAYSHDNNNQSAVTGTNGVAGFRLAPGQYSVYVNKSGWATAQSQTIVTEGQTVKVTLDLAEPFKIAGTVRDAAGAPVAGASVGVFPDYGGGNAGAVTDANGHYSVSWQRPSWAESQNQPAYLLVRQMERKLAAVQEVNDTTTNLDLTLKPAMSVSSHVRNVAGKPITNLTAFITLNQDNSSFNIGQQPIAADGEGRIQAEALPMGQRYSWYVSAQGYGSGHQQMEAVNSKADHYDFPPLVLKLADRKLAGRVLDADRKPIAGAHIWMNGEEQPNGNATTDADGRFAFNAVCAGPISVSANHKDLSASAQTVGGETNLVLILSARTVYGDQGPKLTVTGNVLDPAGNRAVGATVIVTPTAGIIRAVKTDANGDYSVDWQKQPWMRDAKHFVIARDLEKNQAAIEPVDENKTNVSLRLEPGLSISGSALDQKGAPLPSARINLNMMAGNMGILVEYGSIRVGSDGTFTIPALPMGQEYHVYVSAKGYGSSSKNVNKSQSRTNAFTVSPVRLKLADRQLAGKVVDIDNKPIPGAQVNINGDGQPDGYMNTDEDGKFHFTVCDGPVRIFAWSQSGRNNSANAEARGGDVNVVIKMGERPRNIPMANRQSGLRPPAWSLGALLVWPANHKTATLVLIASQAAVLLGTGAGIFWFTRKRK